MIRKLCCGAVLLLSLVGAAALWAQTLPPGVTAGPSAQGITEYRLANGLGVLLFPESSNPTVPVNVTYLVGARHGNYGETGMARLLEHMDFKGTPKHPDIPAEKRARCAEQREHRH